MQTSVKSYHLSDSIDEMKNSLRTDVLHFPNFLVGSCLWFDFFERFFCCWFESWPRILCSQFRRHWRGEAAPFFQPPLFWPHHFWHNGCPKADADAFDQGWQMLLRQEIKPPFEKKVDENPRVRKRRRKKKRFVQSTHMFISACHSHYAWRRGPSLS